MRTQDEKFMRLYREYSVRFGVEPCKTVGVDRLHVLDLRVHRVHLPVMEGGVVGGAWRPGAAGAGREGAHSSSSGPSVSTSSSSERPV